MKRGRRNTIVKEGNQDLCLDRKEEETKRRKLHDDVGGRRYVTRRNVLYRCSALGNTMATTMQPAGARKEAKKGAYLYVLPKIIGALGN